MSSMQEAWDLEKNLISPKLLKREEVDGIIPEYILDDFFGDKMGEPLGIGKDPRGWFVLGTGQGPCIIWQEWDNRTVTLSPNDAYTILQALLRPDPEERKWSPSLFAQEVAKKLDAAFPGVLREVDTKSLLKKP
jgi:hypothetical protein